MEALLAIIALCEKGIAWVNERSRQKKVLFESVVEPLQTAFEKMYEQHLATFATVQDMLSDPKTEPSKIAELVENRVLFESGAIQRLGRLATPSQSRDRGHAQGSGEVGDLLEAYIASVATCLVSPTDYPQRFQVGYYVALADVVNALKRGQDRSLAAKELRRIVERFNRFYADVCDWYSRLQRTCMLS